VNEIKTETEIFCEKARVKLEDCIAKNHVIMEKVKSC
jgi:hypothetical protein